MDKFDQRMAHSKSLAKQRYSSLICLSFLVLIQLLFSLWASSRGSDFAFCVFFIFDFCFLLQKYSKELFLKQIDEAFDDMSNSFSAGRTFCYPMPLYPDAAGSVIWDSIRGRAMHRFRCNPRQWALNFVPVDTENPAACAWAAAWFYVNDDLSYSRNISPDFLKFSIELCEYGFQHDYLSISNYDDWCQKIYYQYRSDNSFSKILDLCLDFKV